MSDQALRVAVPVPVPKLFDYALPAEQSPKAGTLVRVPFGRRELFGVVMGIAAPSIEPGRLKPPSAVLERVLDDHLLAYCEWLAGYYLHPIGEVVATALPTAIRRGDDLRRQPPPTAWRMTGEGRRTDPANLGRAVRQRAVLEALDDATLEQGELLAAAACSRDVLERLAEKGWIERCEPPAPPTRPPPTLSDDQREAVEAIAGKGFRAVLLDGVTGSGKTEVYLSAIGPILEAGRQALVLVPEIGLTPQLIRRFEARFGRGVAAVHSGRSDRERLDAWLRARDGDAAVIIGTRSALFTPFAELGLIVVDEEHDPSLKQQDGLRYSARDGAVKRAQMLDIPVVLGSATPSLESLHNAESGRYQRVALRERVGGARLPEATVIDLRSHPAEDGISPPAYARMARHLERGEQVLVFLNRRGFAPVLMCHACGWLGHCDRCDARLTLHQQAGQLRCHHCGAARPRPDLCPECGSSRLRPLGEGTEKLEQTLSARFPDHPVVRLDRDTVRSQSALDRTLATIREGRCGILLGTQMLAKGHHFPDVTLSLIVNLDQALFSSDFRAAERAGQLLLQVAGRAGRGDKPGRLLLQTHHPEHVLFSTVLQDGYQAFARGLLAERRAARFPPFGHLALLRAEAPRKSRVEAFLSAAARRAGKPAAVSCYGPMPAAMERRAGRFRMQFLIHAERRRALFAFLQPWVDSLHELKESSRVRWSLDIDPAEDV